MAMASTPSPTTNKRALAVMAATDENQLKLSSPEKQRRLSLDMPPPPTEYCSEKTLKSLPSIYAVQEEEGEGEEAHEQQQPQQQPQQQQQQQAPPPPPPPQQQQQDLVESTAQVTAVLAQVAADEEQEQEQEQEQAREQEREQEQGTTRTVEERFTEAQANARRLGKDPSLQWIYDESDELHSASCGDVIFSREELLELSRSSCWAGR